MAASGTRLVAASRFIPIAEETGLIGPLGRYVLREACLQSRAVAEPGRPAGSRRVNIAAAQLRHADFLTMVKEIIEETGIDPKTLELEITEGTMMEVTEPCSRGSTASSSSASGSRSTTSGRAIRTSLTSGPSRSTG